MRMSKTRIARYALIAVVLAGSVILIYVDLFSWFYVFGLPVVFVSIYYVSLLSLRRRGLAITPWIMAIVAVDDHSFAGTRLGRTRTAAFADIDRAIFYYENTYEGMRWVDDAIEMTFEDGSTMHLPESYSGFGTFVKALREHGVEVENVAVS
jgi:hypothetical protein